MSIQLINSTNNIAFQGQTKKTPRGNKYEITHMSRTIGGTVGLLSGALAAKISSNHLKTNAGKRMLITSLNNMGKDLNFFGPVGNRKALKTGLMALAVGISAIGMFIGAAIGVTVDRHNNLKRAKAAYKADKENP